MSTLDTIFDLAAQELPTAGVDYLLIGGWAVNYYGYSRNTLDVDFMIAAEHLESVRRIMLGAGFSNISIGETVAFFESPTTHLRVDFLRVDRETMNRLLAGSHTMVQAGRTLRVPALRDLIAMKLFALANAPAQRWDKDLPDIAYLCVLNELDPATQLLPLCQRFADEALYTKIVRKIDALTGHATSDEGLDALC